MKKIFTITLLLLILFVAVSCKVKQPPQTTSNSEPLEESLIESKEASFDISNANNPLFIGDSRTAQMSEVCDMTPFEVNAAYGQGLTHMLNCTTDTERTSVIWMGVNDPWEAESYINYYKTMDDVIVINLGPVDEDLDPQSQFGPEYSNEYIDEFNLKMSESGLRVIDINSFLWENEFSTYDGLHYTEETYKEIHKYIWRQLGL